MSHQKPEYCSFDENSVLDIVIEYWRLLRLLERVMQKLDAGEANRYVAKIRYGKKRISEMMGQHNLSIVDVEGAVYDPGMAVNALNLADFENCEDVLLVDQMLEPIITGPNGLKRQGTVTLRRGLP